MQRKLVSDQKRQKRATARQIVNKRHHLTQVRILFIFPQHTRKPTPIISVLGLAECLAQGDDGPT